MNKMSVSTIAAIAVSLAVSASPVFAVDDYGSVLTGLALGTATAGIITAGGLKAGLGFCKWAVNKVARFFG